MNLLIKTKVQMGYGSLFDSIASSTRFLWDSTYILYDAQRTTHTTSPLQNMNTNDGHSHI